MVEAFDLSPRTIIEPAQRMLETLTGAWKTQVIHAFAALSVADELSSGPAELDALASRMSVDGPALARLLRAGIALGLVTRDDRGRYASTPLLDTLRRDAAGSLRGYAMAVGMPGHWLPWGQLVEAVRIGGRQTVNTLGNELWDYYQQTPQEAAMFTEAMASLTSVVAAEAASLLDLDEARLAIDVGGASGALVLALMARNPALEGVVLDLPHVIPDALAAAKQRGLDDRFFAVGGSFFEPLPPADIYLLKHVLHDWDDASCRRILRNCSEGLAPGGRVVIIELALTDGRAAVDAPVFGPLMDLTMLVLVPGRERTLDEYEALLSQAGLRLHRTTSLASVTSMAILEAVKA